MSGELLLPGYKSLDAIHSCDIKATIPPLPLEMLRVLAKDWEEILWIHGPAQLFPWQLKEVLGGCFSCLCPGGRLIIETPDRERVLESERPEWIYGDPTLKDPLHMVRWSYTPGEMARALFEAGFSTVLTLPARFHVPDRDFRVEASK